MKRTALGRFTHEGAQVGVAPDGRVVVYMGDDDDFEYLYRFVTAQAVEPGRPRRQQGPARRRHAVGRRFDADGTLTWLPLVAGEGPLTAENGFATQADVVLQHAHGRRPGRRDADGCAGRLRPAPRGPASIYVAMTENEDRLPAGEGDAASRSTSPIRAAPNPDGHILELTPPGAPDTPDHAADAFTWDVFILCGDPREPGDERCCHPDDHRQWLVHRPGQSRRSIRPAGSG